MQPVKSQPNISDAFRKIINKKENLPSRSSVRKMWEDLDKEADKLARSEKKENKLEKRKTKHLEE